jgi:transglutaminase-like putative cysteine protease
MTAIRARLQAMLPRPSWSRRDVAAAALLAVMLACIPLSSGMAQWLLVPAPLWWATALGALAGWALTRRVGRARAAALLIFLIGAAFITLVYSRALPPLRPALRELLSAGRWLTIRLTGLFDQANPLHKLPLPPAAPEWGAARERLQLYGWNLQADLPRGPAGSEWVIGQTLLGSLLGLLVWMAAGLAVWALVRRRAAWPGLVLAMGIVAASLMATWEGWYLLVIGMAAGIALVGDAALRRREQGWRREAGWQPGLLPYGLAVDWWGASARIALGVGAAMLIATAATSPDLHEWLRDTFTTEGTGEGTGLGAARASQTLRSASWPRSYLLGSGPELSEALVMTVQVSDAPPVRFYWRATSYDEYTGQGWVSSTTYEERDSPWPQSTEPPPHFALLRQSFRLTHPLRRVYAVGRPVQTTQPIRGEWLTSNPDELITAWSTTSISAYEVLSWVPTGTPDQLRAASQDYPEWIAETYLALPESLPARVTALAWVITADQPTAYDRALALQARLRTYPYTLDLPAPPTDRDVVDAFLFEMQEGYCDYYASAMVVMARSVGLPARLAAGYATGAYGPETGRYYVTEADAHSWPEIYFPDYGWIPFEPTAARPVPGSALAPEQWEAPSGPEEAASSETAAIPSRSAPRRFWPFVAIPAALAAGIGAVRLMGVLRLRRLRRGAPESIIAALYAMLVNRGRRLGLPLSPAQTPNEFLAALRGELVHRTQHAPGVGGDWLARLACASQAASLIIAVYTDDRYSPRPTTPHAADAALRAWPSLSRALCAYWLAGRFRRYNHDNSGSV